jgi:hypothetical protein
MNDLIEEKIENLIYFIRGKQVILDNDLAKLYGVETKVLNQAVKRNKERFPLDFMFQLTEEETKFLRSQIVTTDINWSKKRYNPHVFTQEGVAMLSGLLRNKKAIEINIKIMRAFISMRKFISKNIKIFEKMDYFERKLLIHDEKLRKVFKSIEVKKPKQGIFYDGQIFDAHKFVSDLINSAKEKIILIDNYVDYNTLLLFSELKGVEVIIYTNKVTDKLKLGLDKFNEQYFEISVKKFDKSHDRFWLLMGKFIILVLL